MGKIRDKGGYWCLFGTLFQEQVLNLSLLFASHVIFYILIALYGIWDYANVNPYLRQEKSKMKFLDLYGIFCIK